MKKLPPLQKTLKYRNLTYVQRTATQNLYLFLTTIPPSTKHIFQSRLNILHLPKKKSLFHTVAYRKITVETVLPIEPSTNTVETLAAYKTVTDDPT